MSNNRQLSLAEVVSIEAWYERFSEERSETDFFLHVRFQDGVFGSDPSHPVRFKVRLRAADVCIMAEEPIKVPKSSVRRDRITIEATHTFEESRDTQIGAEATGSAQVSKTGLSAEAGLKGEAKYSKGRAERYTKKTITHSGMTIEHSVDSDQNNRWSFSPLQGEHLRGQAFNNTEAVMKLAHPGQVSKIPPIVKVRVSCLREHIDIIELEAKDEVKGWLSKGMGEAQKLKLAETILKDALVSNGLEFEGELDANSRLVVADTIATEE